MPWVVVGLVLLVLASRQAPVGDRPALLWTEPARPSRWFSWAELDPEGVRTPETARNLVLLGSQLDRLRDLVGPLRVTSALRSPTRNEQLVIDRGAAPNSDHLRGLAADLVSLAALDSLDLADAVVDLPIPADQAIYYDQARGGHLHLGLRPEGPRLEVRHGVAGTDREEIDPALTADLRAQFGAVA